MLKFITFARTLLPAPRKPLPTKRHSGGMPLKYPWGTLEVGQSFRRTCAPKDLPALRQRLAAGAFGYAQRHPDIKFSVRLIRGGFTITRIK